MSSSWDHDDLEDRACRGDAAAFGQLIRRYDRDLRAVVWTVVRSGPDTDDVMQIAYEKAFRALAAFEGRSSLKSWLHTICYRCALDHVRSAHRRRQSEHMPFGEPDAGPVDGGPSADDTAVARVDLARAFDRLDTDQRVALMLTAGLGYSFDEAAAITGTRRGTVASRASRARRRMEQEMER